MFVVGIAMVFGGLLVIGFLVAVLEVVVVEVVVVLDELLDPLIKIRSWVCNVVACAAYAIEVICKLGLTVLAHGELCLGDVGS